MNQNKRSGRANAPRWVKVSAIGTAMLAAAVGAMLLGGHAPGSHSAADPAGMEEVTAQQATGGHGP